MIATRSNFKQRLDLFKSEITCVLQDATTTTPDSVSVRVDKIQSLLGDCFTEAELRDSLIRKGCYDAYWLGDD